MNGTILQWLQSEPTSDVWNQDAILLSAAILLSCLLLLLVICILGRRRKRRAALAKQSRMADGSKTQELPVAAVQESIQGLNTLTDIVYCESEEIIS